MLPAIRDGDLITISPAGPVPLRKGSIIAFRQTRSRRLMVHRIVAVRGDGFLVRGDNVRSPDGVIVAGDVLGVVTRVERDGKALGFMSPGSGAGSHFIASAYLWMLGARFLARAVFWRTRCYVARVWRTSAGCDGTDGC